MTETNTQFGLAEAPVVFLGGSCNPTTWRTDTAAPKLTAAGVSFYNPQRDDWTPELAGIEAGIKANSKTLLFVIDSETRAIASILEATENIVDGNDVALVVNDIPDGTVIGGQTVTGSELKDLNRARAYLRELASRYMSNGNVTVYATIDEALDAVIANANSND